MPLLANCCLLPAMAQAMNEQWMDMSFAEISETTYFGLVVWIELQSSAGEQYFIDNDLQTSQKRRKWKIFSSSLAWFYPSALIPLHRLRVRKTNDNMEILFSAIKEPKYGEGAWWSGAYIQTAWVWILVLSSALWFFFFFGGGVSEKKCFISLFLSFLFCKMEIRIVLSLSGC